MKIRVTVRYESPNAVGKIVRFENDNESSSYLNFPSLLRKIASKLGFLEDDFKSKDHHDVHHDDDDDWMTSHYSLLLGGGKQVVVEDTSEIEHGDDLILVKKKIPGNNNANNAASSAPTTTTTTVRSSNNHHHHHVHHHSRFHPGDVVMVSSDDAAPALLEVKSEACDAVDDVASSHNMPPAPANHSSATGTSYYCGVGVMKLEDNTNTQHTHSSGVTTCIRDSAIVADAPPDNIASCSSSTAAAAAAAGARPVVSQEPSAHDDDDDDDDNDDCEVEDVTAKQQQQQQQQKSKSTNNSSQNPEIIEISSDDGNDDDDDDESIADGSDAWEEEEDDDDGREKSSSEEEEVVVEDEEESEYSDSDIKEDSDEELPEEPKRKSNKNTTPAESPLEVIMKDKDIPAAPGKGSEQKTEETENHGLEEVSTLVDGAGRKKADRVVKDRIIKLLNTGFHDQSNENEAKNAMKLAQRLMKKHNLSQALLLKERNEKNMKDQTVGGADDEILKGGLVRVNIFNRKTQKPALLARWINNLMHPVATNFDVKCYYSAQRGIKCSVTFYGIYTNAQLAGYAFKVSAERIAQMAAEYQPDKKQRWGSISTKSSRLSYALGIVQGISKEVDSNIRRAEEERLQKLAKARLAQSKGEAYAESDDEGDQKMDVDDDHDNDGPGFASANSNEKAPSGPGRAKNGDKELDPTEDSDTIFDKGTADDGKESKPMSTSTTSTGATSKKPSTVSGEALDRRIEELQNEEQAAIVLVNHSEKVAEKVLKDRNIKLSAGRKRKAIDFDRASYDQGIEDAKEIDINQRAIRDEVKVKKEKKAS